jgi:mono/diheme cytochrome c family protein
MATRKPLLVALLLLAALVAAACAFVWFGVYNVGADDPHTRPMLMLMQTLRGRSIQVRAANLQVPDLEDPQLILKGAGQYAAMCTGCHLAPGLEDSEIRPGLYPQPPNLSRERIDPKVAFWVIKHGVKMSAMPAWGLTHDDPTIWSMVAFLQKLPTLTPTQYQQIVAEAPADEDMDGGGHHHGEGAAMPGMPMMAGAGVAAMHEHGDPAGQDHDETAHQPETTRSTQGLEHGAEPRSDHPPAHR